MNHVKRVGALFTALCALAATAFGGAGVALAANSNSSVVPDQVQRGGVAVVKYDAETKDCTKPQGGADLAGAEFTITNNSDHPVVFADENGKKTTYMVGESWTITTKKVTDSSSPFYGKYVAATSAKALPYGTYHIQETKGSPGYGLATKNNYLNHKYVPGYVTAKMREWVDKGYDFTISADNQFVTFDGENTATKTKDGSGASYTAGPGAYNPLIRGGIEAMKRDHDLLRATPQGNASLEGGTFVIYNYNDYAVQVWDHFDQQSTAPDSPAGNHGPAQQTYHGVNATNYEVTLRSGEKVATQMDENGWVQPGGIVAIIQTGDDGRAQTFMDALPVGWYTVVEREAPNGYVREERWQSYVEVTDDDWDALVVTDCDDPVLRGAAQIQKFDATLLENGTYAFAAGEAQGDGSLKAAHIEIYNNSSKDVWIREANFTDSARGVSYNTGDVSGISGRVGPGEKVAEIVTNEQGIATIKGLPYGSYYAIEKSSSYGYALNSDWRWDFEIKDSTLGKCDADGQQVVAKADGPSKGAKPGDEHGLPQQPAPTKKAAEIWKVDAETGEPISLVDGLPFDMSFEVINASRSAVVFEGKRYEVGASLGIFDTDTNTGRVYFDGSDGDGHHGLLPAGTYRIKEARAPEGYVKSTEVFTMTVTDNGEALTSEGFKFVDKVIREDIQFQKVDSDSMKPMSGIPFLLEKLDKDGNVMESHILVTDEDGMLDTSGDISGYQGWRARMKDGKPHYNLADKYYDEATGEFTYVAPVADKQAVLEELNGDGTAEHPGYVKELEDLMAQLDELLTKADVAGIKSLYDELVEIVRDANAIAMEKGDQSPEYAAKVAEQADKIVEIHEAIAVAKAAVGDDYAEQIEKLEADIRTKEAQIKDAQGRLAKIDDELSGDSAIWETGYWFFGGAQGDGIKPNEADGALPYGDYRLTELRCEANKGYDLVSRDIHVKRGNGLVENYGTIDNKTYPDCDPCADVSVHGLDVDMHKDSSPAPNSMVKHGSDITYTLSYENTSAETVPYLLVRDAIPESTTFKSADNGGVFVKDKDAVEWVVTDVEPGATGTVSFTVTVDKGARSIIANQARFGTYKTEVVAGDNDENPIGSTNLVKHTTDGTKTGAYLSAVKRSEPAPGSTVKIGDQIKYFVDVTNKGDTDMEAVAVVDTIPVGTKLASSVDENYYDVDVISDGGYRVGNDMVGWNIGTLKAGETKTVSFTVDVTEDVRYSVSNQATFGASRAKCTGLLDNTTNIVTHKVETLPELTITKSCDRERTTAHGEILTYTLHVENNGRGNAINVPVYDIIPEGTQYVMGSISTDVRADESHTYPFTSVEGDGAADATELVEAKPYVNWTIPVLYNRGGSMDLTYQVRVRDDVAVGDIIKNRATVGGEGPLGVDVEEPTVTTDVTVPAVSNLIEHEVVDAADDVEVIKTANPVDGSSVAPGDEITYTVTATNNGEHSVHGFGIRDAIPEHTSFVDGSIVVVGADGKSSTEIAEEAQQQTQEGDECGTVPDDVSIVWTPEATLSVGNMNEADAESIYKIVVPNEEQYKIYSWGTIKRALTHLGVGESIEFEVTSTDGYNLYWRATYMEDGRLLLWKRVLVPNATDSVNYTRANGVYANYDQRWNDVYAITDELKPGETITLTFTVKVDDDVENNTEIHNVATYGHGVYSAPCFDLDHESNTTTHVVGAPHLVSKKTVDKTDARRGDVLTYTVTITNDGTARAKNVAIHDEFREASALNGMTYVVGSWSVSGGDGAQASEAMAGEFDASTRFVAARCNTLEPGETLTMTFQCLIADAVDGDILTNKATWEANHEGNPIYGDLSEETNEVSTRVGEPKLSIEKTVDPQDGTVVEVGDTLTYTFKVTNDSAVYTNDAAVFDMIPTYTTLVDGSLTGGLEVVRGVDVETVDENGETVSAPGPVIGVGAGGIHLDSGESREFSFKVSVDSSLVKDVTISNTATAGFSDGTPSMPLQTASNTTVNDAKAPDTELRIVKSADPAGGTDLHVGDVITYTFTVLNESTTPAEDVCVFDYIPDYTTFVQGSATGGLKYVDSGLVGDKPAVVASGLTLGANESREMTFQVKVNDTLDDLVVSNRATVGEFRGDPTAPLDIDSNEVISNVIAPKPAISITDFADPESGTQVKAGDIVTYTFTVTETEGVPAEGIAVFDYVPANTTFVEGSETGGLKTIKNSAGAVVALYADGIDLAANGSAEFSFQVEVGHVTSDTEIANQPTAGFATEPKLPLAQVGATMTHNIIAEKPVLRLTKTATPDPGTAVSAGDVIDYSFTVSNDSDAIARGVAVFDRVPENTTYVAGSAEGLSEITDENGVVVALYADEITLAGHRSRSFTFSVEVNDGDDLIISNRATAGFASAPTTDLELDSNEVLHGSATPDVRVTKASTPSATTVLEAGDVITYTITVRNASTGADHDVVVYDAIPEGTTFVDGSLIAKGSAEAKFADGAIAVRYDKVAGKATHNITFKVSVNDEFGGHIENVATFGHGTELPTAPLSDATNATENVAEAAQPILRLTKAAEPKNGVAVSAGDEITYTFTLSNEGEGWAHGAAVYDRIPENATFVDGTESGLVLTEAKDALYADGLEIAPGASKTFSFAVTATGEGGSIISNRATAGFASAPTTDLELDSNEVVNAIASPDTNVTKRVLSQTAGKVSDGDVIEYGITVRNAGDGADFDVVVSDLIPEGTTYVDGSLAADGAKTAEFADGAINVSYDRLDAGATKEITFKVTVDDEFDGTVSNVAKWGHGDELDHETNAASTLVAAKKPHLAIVQSSDPVNGTAVSLGDVITYTIKVTNDGAGYAHDVAIFDAVPEHSELIADTLDGLVANEDASAVYADGIELAPGKSKTVSFQVRVTDNAGVQIVNHATCGFATAPKADLDLDANEIVHLADAPATNVTKAASVSATGKLTDGDEITYTITVRNASTGADFDVNVVDEIPAGTTYVDDSLVAEGASAASFADGAIHLSYDKVEGNANIAASFKVRIDDEFDGTVTNVAKWGHGDELDHETNAASSIVGAKQPNLHITKEASTNEAVSGGDQITYTITVSNDGEGIARGVAVFDRIPAHTVYVDGSATGLELTETGDALYADGLVIKPGESKTFSFTVEVQDSDGAVISNRATCGFAEAPTTDLELDSNEVTNNSVDPDIRVTKTADIDASGYVSAGQEITYTIKVENASAGAAYNVGVFDQIPTGTTYVPRTMRAKGADQTSDANRSIAAHYAKIDGNTTREISFKVRVNDEFSGQISNIATWGDTDHRPVRPLPEQTNSVDVIAKAAEPLLRIEQSSVPENGSMISVGDEITYTILLSNDGAGIAHDVAVFDRIPAHCELVEGSYEGLTLTDDGSALYADGIELNPGSETSFTFTVRATEADASIINHVSTGFATAPTHDLEIDANEIAHTTLASDVRVTKTSDVDASTPLKAGDEITYTIKVENASAGADVDFGVYDQIPAGTTYVAKSLVANGADQKSDANEAIAVRYAKLDGKSVHTISFKVRVNGDQNSVANVATFGHATELPEGTLAEQTPSVINTVEIGGPELRLTKTANPGPGVALSVGDEIAYTITLTNDSDVAGSGIAVFDRIPDHTTYVDGSAEGLTLTESGDALYADGIELGAHETKTFTFKARVEDEGVIISNRATAGIADAPTTDLELDSNEVVNAAEAPNTEISLASDPVNGATVTEGSDITYTITVKNTGRGNDRDVAVYAPIPEGTAYVEGSLVANDAESIAQTTDGTVTGIAAHYDVFAANSTSVITFKVRVMDTAGATIDEKATLGHVAELSRVALEIESNQVSHILDKAPVLSIVKSQDPGSGAWVAGGDTLTYSIKVTNEGNTIARKVGIYDEAPEHTKYVAGSLSTDRGEVYEGSDGLLTNIAGDLVPGDSVTMTFKVKVDLGFVGTIYNRAMWVSPAADPEVADAGDADVDAPGDTQADGTSSDAAPAAEGVAAPAATVVPSTRLLGVLGATVPIPEGSYSGISNEVTAGGAASETPSDETPSDTTPEPADPTPAPSDQTPAGEPGSNEVNAGVKAAEVKITKTATPSGTVKSGSTITYTIRLENTGDVNANSLYMRDVMPAGVTFKPGTVTVSGMTYEVKDGNVIGRCSLKPSEVATVSFQATVGNDFSGDIVNVAEWGQAEAGAEPTEMLGSSKVTNIALADELSGDSNEVNAYVNKPTIQLIKSSDPEDGSIVKPGTKVTYTLAATNVGRVNANDLYILDEIPEGLTVDAESVKGEGLDATFADGKLVARGSLHPTESATVTFEATVGESFVGDIMNQAKWGQAEEGEEPETFDGNSNEDLIHVGTTEVGLIKSCDHADGTFVSRGAKLVYTIEAENKGTLDVDMIVTDKVPEGTTFESFETVDGKGEVESDTDGTITFKPGNLKPGEKAAFKFTVVVNDDVTGDIRNVANWTDGGENSGESNSIINHVSDPKISVTKTNDAEGGKVRPGQTVSYVISVTNSGTTKGLVRVTDEIPTGLTLDKDSVRVMTNSIVDTVVMDDETVVDADASSDAQQPADVDTDTQQQADAGDDQQQATDSADSQQASDATGDASDAVDAAGDTSADAADAVTGDAASDVTSGEDEISVEVKDNSPFGALTSAFTSFVDWITGAESDEADIVVDDASIKGAFYIAPNQTVAITYEAKVAEDAELGKAITNVVNTEVEGGDPSHSESVVTPGEPNVTMAKSTDVKTGASVKVGDTITYSINVTNSGTATSDIITMTDTIPDKTSYVAGSAMLAGEGGSLAAVAEENLVTKDASGKVTGVAFEVGRLEPGETSATLSFQVKVDETGEISDIENVAHWTAVADPDDPKPTKPEPSNPIVTPVEPTKPGTKTKGPKLEIKKIGVDSNGKETSSFKAGSTQDWKITVTNSGDETATNVSVKDLLGTGLSFVKATEGNRTLSAEVAGHASATSAYASKIAASAKALQNSDGTYSVGVSSFKDGYLYGSATEGVSANDYATAIPSGTYEVTIASGYRGALQVIAMDESGKVVTTAGAQGTLGYRTSVDKLTVTIPENGRLVLTCQKNANDTWTDANTSEHAWTFKPTGETHLPETSTSGEYSVKFVIDKIEAGKSSTIMVTTKTSADAPAKVTNTAKAYLGASDKDAVTSSATLNRSDYSEPAKKADNTETLPKTAAAIAGLLVVAAGVGAFGYGIAKLRRKDEDADERPAV